MLSNYCEYLLCHILLTKKKRKKTRNLIDAIEKPKKLKPETKNSSCQTLREKCHQEVILQVKIKAFYKENCRLKSFSKISETLKISILLFFASFAK